MAAALKQPRQRCRRPRCRCTPSSLLLLVPVVLLHAVAATCAVAAAAEQQQQQQQPPPLEPHTSNWAVIVSTSKYWYNYRHAANALSFYRTVKRLGVPDSHIVLMLAEDAACNARNAYPGRVFNDERHALDVYGRDVEVDYRGAEVTVDNFVRVLTGRHDPAVPRPKRMLSDAGSNVLVYISGHGGNEFMKFQDTAELMAQDVADALEQMREARRYRELLLVVETCQAATLYSRTTAPRVLAMASSLKGESSYSHTTDADVGLSLIDRFTWSTLDFFERVGAVGSRLTLADLAAIYRFDVLESTFHYDASRYGRPLASVPVTDFFGSVAPVRATPPLDPDDGDGDDDEEGGDGDAYYDAAAAAWQPEPVGEAAAAAAAAAAASRGGGGGGEGGGAEGMVVRGPAARAPAVALAVHVGLAAVGVGAVASAAAAGSLLGAVHRRRGGVLF